MAKSKKLEEIIKELWKQYIKAACLQENDM